MLWVCRSYLDPSCRVDVEAGDLYRTSPVDCRSTASAHSAAPGGVAARSPWFAEASSVPVLWEYDEVQVQVIPLGMTWIDLHGSRQSFDAVVGLSDDDGANIQPLVPSDAETVSECAPRTLPCNKLWTKPAC